MHKPAVIVLLLMMTVLLACSPSPAGNITPTPAQRLSPIESPEVVLAQENETAIVWERSGGIAGICQRLTIQFSGAYKLVHCIHESMLYQGELSSDQWKQLFDWLQKFTTFEFGIRPPEGSADVYIDTYVFNGQGDQQPSIEKQQEINEHLAMLANSLTKPVDGDTLDAHSGIQGRALLGPICPGPQQAGGLRATQCADQPYQAKFKILDEQENEIATFQTGEDGRYKVALDPGTYELVPQTNPQEIFPRASSQSVTVLDGEYIEITIIFDTGIR